MVAGQRSPKPDAALGAFMPGPVARMAAALELDAPRPAFLGGDGVVLFCDISGFTALTERLAREGMDGAEVLSRILESVFERIVGAIAVQGGEVVAFPGDAVIAVWSDPRPLEARVHAASAAALAIQASLAERTPLKGESLTVRIGIEAGPVVHALLGGGGQYVYLLSGTPLAALGRLTDAVAPGTIGIAAHLEPQFADAEISRSAAEPHVRLEHLLRASDAAADVPPRPSDEFVAAFVPAVVRDRMAAGQGLWLSEFRRVSVLFVGLSGLRLDDEMALEDAQKVVDSMQRGIARHQGNLLQLVVDEHGPTALAVWGLPGDSHDNDAELAVRAALRIGADLAGSGHGAACAVTTGRAFCGLRGAERRREYAVFGAVVNRAARLMARARPDGVVCDRVTAERAGERLRFEELGEVTLKGIAEPVALLRPEVVTRETNVAGDPEQHRYGRLIGRIDLLDRLVTQIDSVAAGEPAAALIEGEPGIGKSHLVSVFCQEAARTPVTLVVSTADAVEQSTPYYAWRSVFRQLFADHTGDELEQRLGAQAQWLPLVTGVLPVEIEETAGTRQLEGEARANRGAEVLVALLASVAAEGSLVVVIDDAHWFDTLSWTLAARVAIEIGRCLLVLAHRPLDEPQPVAYARIRSSPGCVRLPLAPLSETDSVELLAERLGVQELPEEVGVFVQSRANGNPLFSEQIAFAMLDSDAIRIEAGICTLAGGAGRFDALDVPDTVEGVITGRIDRLSVDSQLTAKVASAVGRGFDFRTLFAVHPLAPDGDTLAPHLSTLTARNFVSVEAPEPELAYLFTHVIVQEVLYGLLSFDQRRRLHCAIAAYLERLYGDDLEPHLPLLAHHWQRGEDRAKAVYYLERAGKQALDQFANTEAIRFFHAAVEIDAEALPGVSDHQRSRWHWWLGIAHLKLSDYAQCSVHQVRGLSYLGFPVPARRATLAASLVAQVGVQLMHRLLPGRWMVQNPTWAERFVQASDMYRYRAEYGYFNTDVLWAVQAMLKCLNFAERGGDNTQVAGAYAALGVVAGIGGQHWIASYYSDRALTLAESMGDKSTLAFVHQLIAVYRHSLGSWDIVSEHAGESVALFAEVGDRFRWEGCLSIQVMLHLHRCELDALDAVAERMYQSAHPDSAPQMRTYAYGGRLASAILRGRVEPGLLDDTNAVLLEVLAHGEQIFCHGLLAWGYAARGDTDAAHAAAERALAIADAHPPGTYYNKFPLDGAAEVVRARWAQARQRRSGDAEALAKSVRRARRVLRRFAALSPVSNAARWLYEGRVAATLGRQRRAARYYEKSLAEAARFDLDFDRFRALDALRAAVAVPRTRQLECERLATVLFDSLDLSQTLRNTPVEGAE